MIGYPLAQLVDGSGNLSGWHQVWWIAHVVSFTAFLLILPITMLRHMFTSPLNMYLRDRERPKGAMRALPKHHPFSRGPIITGRPGEECNLPYNGSPHDRKGKGGYIAPWPSLL